MTTDSAIKAKELVKELGANKAWSEARSHYLKACVLINQADIGYWEEVLRAISSENKITIE